jgi:8-oxo-dGTP diphosphatase
MQKYSNTSDYHEIDWTTWQPVEKATLLFVIDGDRVLLIEKKRGLGAGKINGPGGRLEAGETLAECAVRETQEELLITATGVEAAGELNFQFTNGHSIQGFVYKATGWVGEPTETDEAKPFWCSLDEIPFGRMWADDAIWIPHMLNGKTFLGRFLFDDDTMLGHEFVERDITF